MIEGLQVIKMNNGYVRYDRWMVDAFSKYLLEGHVNAICQGQDYFNPTLAGKQILYPMLTDQ